MIYPLVSPLLAALYDRLVVSPLAYKGVLRRSWTGGENSLKPSKDTYKAYPKSTTHSDH